MRRILPRWRKATWALVIWCALILIWAIVGGGSANEDCLADATSQAERAGCDVGTGIGVAIIFLIGFFGFLFFSLIWLMSRPKNRQCPRCGNDVKKGIVQCATCGWDMGQLAQQAPPQPGTQA